VGDANQDDCVSGLNDSFHGPPKCRLAAAKAQLKPRHERRDAAFRPALHQSVSEQCVQPFPDYLAPLPPKSADLRGIRDWIRFNHLGLSLGGPAIHGTKVDRIAHGAANLQDQRGLPHHLDKDTRPGTGLWWHS